MTDQDTPRKSIQALFDENPWPRNMVKARKDHRCDVCNWRIAQGTLHISYTIYPGDGNDNDHIFTYHAHADCDVLINRFGEAMGNAFPWTTDWGYWLEILDEAHVEYPMHWRK